MADNKQDWGELDYAYHKDKLIIAESIPDLDGWLWDSYWNASNWIYWFNRNVDKYGEDIAREKWNKYANMHTIGAAFNDWKLSNQAWVEFAQLHNLDINSTLVSQVINIPGDVVDVVANVVDGAKDVSKSTKWIIWLLLGLLALYLISKLKRVNYRPASSSNKYSRYSSLRNKKFRSR